VIIICCAFEQRLFSIDHYANWFGGQWRATSNA